MSKLLSISAFNLKSLKFPCLESSLSKILPSSLWPLKPIPCRPHYSIARITDERNFYSAFLNILNFVLHGHSIFFMVVMKFSKRAMESLWYWRIECPLSSSDPCFQSLYGWAINILALLLSLAPIGNKTHARQKKNSFWLGINNKFEGMTTVISAITLRFTTHFTLILVNLICLRHLICFCWNATFNNRKFQLLS